jgi:hypothetical protein
MLTPTLLYLKTRLDHDLAFPGVITNETEKPDDGKLDPVLRQNIKRET